MFFSKSTYDTRQLYSQPLLKSVYIFNRNVNVHNVNNHPYYNDSYQHVFNDNANNNNSNNNNRNIYNYTYHDYGHVYNANYHWQVVLCCTENKFELPI